MGWLTYTILIALHMGLSQKFTPGIFATTVEWSLGIGLLENLICKVAFSTIQPSTNFALTLVDWIAINGQKYIHMSCIALPTLLLPSSSTFWLLFVYFAGAAGFSQYKCLVHLQSLSGYQISATHTQLIMASAVMQVLLMWFMIPSLPIAPEPQSS